MGVCRVLMITSCKGGVGKSTVAANLGHTLALSGKRVLLIDLDLGMRCLDLILGVEDQALYDISDVVGGVPAERAVIKYPGCESLHFIAAPYTTERTVDADAFKAAVCDIRDGGSYDYIIVDTPGDIGYPFTLACSVADAALIVASHGPSTIRAAEHTARQLEAKGVSNMRLIINNYDIADHKGISSGERASIIDIIDRTYLRLLGVIPYDAAFARAQEHGRLAGGKDTLNVAVAFSNIGKRIDGEQVSLFKGFKKISRKKLL